MTRQFLSAGQQRRLQSLNERQMPDEVTILVPDDPTPDGYGAETQTYSDGPTVKCRVRPSTGRADAVQGGKGGPYELWSFTLPVDTEVLSTYRLRRNDVEYEVVGEPSDSSHQIGLHVLARKL